MTTSSLGNFLGRAPHCWRPENWSLDRYKTLLVYAVVLDNQDLLVYSSVVFYLFSTKMHAKVFLNEHCLGCKIQVLWIRGSPDSLNLALSVNVLKVPMEIWPCPVFWRDVRNRIRDGCPYIFNFLTFNSLHNPSNFPLLLYFLLQTYTCIHICSYKFKILRERKLSFPFSMKINLLLSNDSWRQVK